MKKIRLFSLHCLNSLLFLALIFLGCEKRIDKETKLLRLCSSYDPYTLDPRLAADRVSMNICYLLFEGLMRQTEKNTVIKALANHIVISPDEKSYLFHLRETYWSDGMPITADDFVQSWKSILSPYFPAANAPLFYCIKNAEAAKQGKKTLEEVGVYSLDERTLCVDLEFPVPYFLELVSFCAFFPTPQHKISHSAEWPHEEFPFVSNGPFLLQEWKHNNYLSFIKNPIFWESQTIKLDAISLSIIPHSDTAYALFKKGDLDLVGNPFSPLPQEAIPNLPEDELLESRPIAATMVCGFNTQKFPFTNSNIRKAFALSIDRNAIIEHISQMGEIPAFGLVCPILKKGKVNQFFKEDVDKAKMYLEEGLKELDCDLQSLNKGLRFIYTGEDLNYKIVQELQQQWQEKLGIKISLERSEFRGYLNKLAFSDFDLIHATWFAQFNDPVNILERFKYLTNGKNYVKWENSRYIELLDDSYTTNLEIRNRLLLEAERLFIDEMPLAPLYHWNCNFLKKPYVEGLFVSLTGAMYFNCVDLKTED